MGPERHIQAHGSIICTTGKGATKGSSSLSTSSDPPVWEMRPAEVEIGFGGAVDDPWYPSLGSDDLYITEKYPVLDKPQDPGRALPFEPLVPVSII